GATAVPARRRDLQNSPPSGPAGFVGSVPSAPARTPPATPQPTPTRCAPPRGVWSRGGHPRPPECATWSRNRQGPYHGEVARARGPQLIVNPKENQRAGGRDGRRRRPKAAQNLGTFTVCCECSLPSRTSGGHMQGASDILHAGRVAQVVPLHIAHGKYRQVSRGRLQHGPRKIDRRQSAVDDF